MSQNSRKPSQEEIELWNRARRLPPGTEKTVECSERVALEKMGFRPKEGVVTTVKDGRRGKVYSVTLRVGECPCAVCNHEHMLECDKRSPSPKDRGCECCSGFCS